MTFKMDKKKGIIAVVSVVILAIIGTIFYFEKIAPKVLTKNEYIKEVIIQNKDFDKVLDNYLDQVVSYNGSKESYEKFIATSEKFPKFVSDLEEKLGPRVPTEARDHYNQMMAAYKIYLEAIEMYKKAVPKNFGEERTTLIKEAQDKLAEAKSAMQNIS